MSTGFHSFEVLSRSINSSSFSTKKPLMLFSTISFVPPGALKAITGVPTEHDSIKQFGNPSK